jgi:hypothetical protein
MEKVLDKNGPFYVELENQGKSSMKTLADSQGWSLEIKIFYSCINLS